MKKIDYTTYKKPTDFIKFQPGDNKIRIISDGLLARFHGTRMGGRYVPLGLCSESGDCPHCLGGNEAKRVWRWVAYDYATKEVKLLDAGPMIGDQICVKAVERKQDPQEFDLIINKVGVGLKTKYDVKAVDATVKSSDFERFKPMRNFIIKKYFQVNNAQTNQAR
jgi:hypothetical protein